ncbi:MAG TPA: DM9 repeat-containing protein [Gammaproteobacteria bacterium]|jgi:hypothetical protein|nr:DM9 repeat-containing protein [Gammaproteobacteria bacterium]
MKKTMNAILLSASVLALLFNGLAMADTDMYYTNVSPDSHRHSNEHRHRHESISLSANIPHLNTTYVVTTESRHHHHNKLAWVDMVEGQPLPVDAVVGGSQPQPYATLYVCRGNYGGGIHPGKLYNGFCNISWGGSEISLAHYQVLVSHANLAWVGASNGFIPMNAVEGGYQHDGPLYICQAAFQGGMHVGKVYGQNCNIGWSGREEIVPYYNVLVRNG